MFSDFAKFVAIAQEEGFRNTPEGIDAFYGILEHLSEGGTVSNYPNFTRDEVNCMLAAGWVDAREASDSRTSS